MAFLLLLIDFSVLLWTTRSFNLETSRPIIYRGPEGEGSYFGMSVAIRPTAASGNRSWTVQIGAPRGRLGGGGPGPGTVSRCRVRGPCRILALDEGFPAVGGRGALQFEEKKDAAWIGVAMDVGRLGPRETSVVCGHRWMNQNLKNPENIDVTYLVTGVCYLQELRDEAPETSGRRLLPLADKGKIYTPKPYAVDLSTYHWGLGQAGISVNLVEAPRHLLIGAPGVTHWVGSVVRYDENLDAAVANFARTEIARHSRYPYLGYSVAFGRFYKDREIWYVAGAPRSANYRGQVFTFQFKGSSDDVNVQSSFTGATFGEYFGSSVATVDLNGDSFDDIVVGAPLFSNKDPDEGRIYVYLGTGRGNFLVPAQVVDGRAGRGRFGSCVASIGDLDQDGYDDVAVGAPYEDDNEGAVYIYRGFSRGLHGDHAQRIRARDVHPQLRGFGVSISRGVDVDGNKYADVAVGSHLSGHVALLRSRPVISLHPSIRTENGSLIDRKDAHFNVTVCSRYAGTNAPAYVDIVRTIEIDPVHGRGKLDPKFPYRKSVRLRVSQVTCEVHHILLNTSRKNFSPLQITVRNEIGSCSNGKGSASLIQGETENETDDFPKDCPLGETAEASKEIAFAGVCGADLTCRSDLELSCAVPHFRSGFHTLGSAEFLVLSMDVKNHGEPAQETKIKIWSNLKLRRRGHQTASEASGKTFWLEHDGVLAENFKANFSFEIDLEALEDNHLDLMVEITTSSLETDLQNNNCKFSVKLRSDASLNFDASSSAASAYITTAELRHQTLNVTHHYEVRKSGVSPLKYIDLSIYVPFYFKKEFLTFERVELTEEGADFTYSHEEAPHLGTGRGGPARRNSHDVCPPTDRTLFLNCSTAENNCTVMRMFFSGGILRTGVSAYVKIFITLNVTALDIVRAEKDIVFLSTTGVLKFSKFFERQPEELETGASTVLYGEKSESHVDTRVVALSVLAGGFLLTLIVTGLVKSNFFKRVKKQQLQELKDADASFVYFATTENFHEAATSPAN